MMATETTDIKAKRLANRGQAEWGVLVVSGEAQRRQAVQAAALALGCVVRAGSDAKAATAAIDEGCCRIVVLGSDVRDFGPDACRGACRVAGMAGPYLIWMVDRASMAGEGAALNLAAAAGADDLVIWPAHGAELTARLSGAKRVIEMQRELEQRTRREARLNQQYMAAAEQVRTASMMDELTGLPNRRATLAGLASMWAVAGRHGGSLAAAMIEVDGLRLANDLQGTAAGDALLSTAASAIAKSIRVEDVAGRFSGSNFLLLMPHTPAGQAVACVERCREAAEMNGITLTAGVAPWSSELASPQELLSRAEAAREQARRPGSGVVCWGAVRPNGRRVTGSAA
jgi:diguanylate cyclase (GGDEF)-like protein